MGDEGFRGNLGVVLNGEGMSLHELVDYGISLEAAGFHSVWHEEIFRDPFVPLAAIAAGTSELRLGTAVSTWTRSPVSSALIAANLDQLSDGRYTHGIGTGPAAWNEQYHSIKYERPRSRMRDYVGAVRAAWSAHSGRFVDFDGEHFSLDQYFRPIGQEREDIPLYLAAVQKNMLRLAGAVADGVIMNVLTTRRYYEEIGLPNLLAGAQSAGRDPADVHRAALVTVAVDDDERQAVHWAKHQIAFFAQIPYFESILGPYGFWEPTEPLREAAKEHDIERMLESVTDEMVAQLTVAGTPEQCRRQLARWDYLDSALLTAPSYFLSQEEIAANYRAIAAAFAPS
jgi:probable F420-dependent oxidoreductase